ncbi:hypothetical protein AAHE18_17G135100 [Arachis hypogaea]
MDFATLSFGTTLIKSKRCLWNKVGVSNVAGEVALLAGLVMWATNLPLISSSKKFSWFLLASYLVKLLN